MPRLSISTTHGRLTAVALALAFGISGCGGGEVEYQEVPGEPADITLPESASPDAEATDEATATEDEATTDEGATGATPEATPAPEAGTGTDTTTDQSTADAEAPAAAEDGPDSDQAPVPGSDAERFEDFCEQNAGAC